MRRRIVLVNSELDAIEAIQPVFGAKPDVAAAVLEHAEHGRLRQALFERQARETNGPRGHGGRRPIHRRGGQGRGAEAYPDEPAERSATLMVSIPWRGALAPRRQACRPAPHGDLWDWVPVDMGHTRGIGSHHGELS